MTGYRTLAWIAGTLYLACLAAGIGLTIAMTAVVAANIVARYWFDYALSWAEEAARYMMVWVVLLGAAMAVHRPTHFRMELLEHRLGAGGRAVLLRLGLLAAGALGALLVWQGSILVRLAHHQLATATRVPMSVAYVSLPLAGALMIVFALERAVRPEPEHARERSGGDRGSAARMAPSSMAE